MEASQSLQDLDPVGIRNLLDRMTLPSEIEGMEVRFANDSTGDPGLFITFSIKPGVQLSSEDLQRLTKFTSEATEQIIRTGIQSFPYIDLQQVS